MWNDRETDLDLLGHQKIAQTIVSILDEQELRPLTIGVYGSWGAGKSSVLSLITGELKDNKDTLCITFNSWLYQGYEDTRSALMESVVSELVRLQPTDKKMVRLGKTLLKRINWLKVAKMGGGLALTALTGMPNPALWGTAGLLKGAASYLGYRESDDKAEGSDDQESFFKEEEDTVPRQIHAFREELRVLIETSKVSRIVVLVDELDRCLPAAVIDILEAIRLFLFVEGTVFVLAADEQMIEYAVRRHFPDLPVAQAAYTKHYLEKLVQIPIRVPSLNQLQTKNYIRFLLLQHELQNDKARLKEICHAFETSKTSPYENIDFTYDFMRAQLRSESPKIRTVMHVAEQIGAILADELRGNPRNIKRFLNTIFFRLRVASVYSIQDKVHLDALSKLALLERFHSQEYEKIVDDVTTSPDGKSGHIQDLEDHKQRSAARTKKKALLTSPEPENFLHEWAALEPSLKDVDLRPYVFVSKEKAVGFSSTDDLPETLASVYEVLASGAKVAMAGREADIKALSEEHAMLLFNKLATESQKVSDWSRTPPQVAGIIYLVQWQSALEEKFVHLLDAVPSERIRPWMLSNLAGFKSKAGIAAKSAFFNRIISNPKSSKAIISIAKQTLNT